MDLMKKEVTTQEELLHYYPINNRSLPAFAGQALRSFDYEGGFDIYKQVAPTELKDVESDFHSTIRSRLLRSHILIGIPFYK